MTRIIAIFAVRNEERFMRRAISHLVEQDVDCYIIDNGSTDRTVEIARHFLGRGVIGIEHFPFDGIFEWLRLLRRKEQICRELGPGWYIHEDADQFRFAPNPWASLREGVEAADAAGFNAIEFDTFDFVPTSAEEDFDHERFLEEMTLYYYFCPKPLHQVKMWKYYGQEFDITQSAGHQVVFDGRRIFPVPFILRHYPALSRNQAIEKYCSRVHNDEEVHKRGWHGTRVGLRPEDLRFPDRSKLKRVSADNTWDTTDPWSERYPLPPAK